MSSITITREQLVKAAEYTLDETQECIPVPDALRADVLEVARTAGRVTLGYWNGECGCLVGTLRTRRGDDPYPTADDDVEAEIGCMFVRAMSRLVRAEYGRETWHLLDSFEPIEVAA